MGQTKIGVEYSAGICSNSIRGLVWFTDQRLPFNVSTYSSYLQCNIGKQTSQDVRE